MSQREIYQWQWKVREGRREKEIAGEDNGTLQRLVNHAGPRTGQGQEEEDKSYTENAK